MSKLLVVLSGNSSRTMMMGMIAQTNSRSVLELRKYNRQSRRPYRALIIFSSLQWLLMKSPYGAFLHLGLKTDGLRPKFVSLFSSYGCTRVLRITSWNFSYEHEFNYSWDISWDSEVDFRSASGALEFQESTLPCLPPQIQQQAFVSFFLLSVSRIAHLVRQFNK